MNTHINYEDLFRDNVAAVYRFAYYRLNNKAKAEDITAEAFKRLLEKQDLNPELARFWLFRVARNLIYNQTKAESTTDVIDETTSNLEDESAEDFDQTLLTEELQKLIRENLSALPERTQEVIALKVWEDMTFAQIADVIAEKESTVKLRYYRGLEKLKELLADKPETRHLSIALLVGGIAAISQQSAYLPANTFIQNFISTSLITLMETNTMAATTAAAAGQTTTAAAGFTGTKLAVGALVTTTVVAVGGGAALVMNNNAQRNPITNNNTTSQATTTTQTISSVSSAASSGGYKILPQTAGGNTIVLTKDETYLIDKCGATFKPFYDNAKVVTAPANMTLEQAQTAMKNPNGYGWSYSYEVDSKEARFSLNNVFFADKNNPALTDEFSTSIVINGSLAIVCRSNDGLTVKDFIAERIAEFKDAGGTLTYTKQADERVFGIKFAKYEQSYNNGQSKSTVYLADNGEYIMEMKVSNTTKDGYDTALANLRKSVKAKLAEIRTTSKVIDADPFKTLGDTCKVTYTAKKLPGFSFDYDVCEWKLSSQLPDRFANAAGEPGDQTGEIKLSGKAGTLFIDLRAFYDAGPLECLSKEYKLVNGTVGRYMGYKFLSDANIYAFIHEKGTAKFNLATSVLSPKDPNWKFCTRGYFSMKDVNGINLDVNVSFIGKGVDAADKVVATIKGLKDL